MSPGAPDGEVVAGVFLVDLGCLGVKNAYHRRFSSLSEYNVETRSQITLMQPMVEADLNLAAKIIREAIAYARSLGFKPHRDYQDAAFMLDGADPDAAPDDIPLGLDGKPYFINGPYDDVRTILRKLTQAVGEGNFHFVAGGPGPAMNFRELEY